MYTQNVDVEVRSETLDEIRNLFYEQIPVALRAVGFYEAADKMEKTPQGLLLQPERILCDLDQMARKLVEARERVVFFEVTAMGDLKGGFRQYRRDIEKLAGLIAYVATLLQKQLGQE